MKRFRKNWLRTFGLGAALAATSSAWGGDPKVVFSNIQTSPTSIVPGSGGTERFKPGTATQFDRVFVSPNGRFWILRALANAATTTDELVITGSGINGNSAAVRAREGTPTSFDGSVNYGVVRQQMGINDNQEYAFSADTTYPTANDDVVVRGFGNTIVVMAREGNAIPGSSDFFGSTNDSVNIISSGAVDFLSRLLTGASTEDMAVRMTSPTTGEPLVRTNVNVPNNQTSPAQFIDILTANGYRTNGNGTKSIYHADLFGPTTSDIVTVVDTDVVAQEGSILPNSSFLNPILSMDGASGVRQIAGDHWAFRGSNATDSIDWAYSDLGVLATTDNPIVPGSSELFDDAPFAATFFVNTVNELGDYVVGGTTNNANTSDNAVLIYRGGYVLDREGAGVDVDGDGVLNDNAFLSVFNNDDSVLTRRGQYFFMADLRDSLSASIGQAIMVQQVGVQPSSYSVVQGLNFGGSIDSLKWSDNDRIVVLNDELDATAEVVFSATSSVSSAARMQLHFEHSASRNDLSAFCYARNFSTASWTNVNFSVSTFVDSFFSVMAPGSGSDYIDGGTNEMRARIVWIPSQDIDAGDGWTESVNVVSFIPLQ